MRGVSRSILVLFSLGFFTVASTQLPPEIIADKYLSQASKVIDIILQLSVLKEVIFHNCLSQWRQFPCFVRNTSNNAHIIHWATDTSGLLEIVSLI